MIEFLYCRHGPIWWSTCESCSHLPVWWCWFWNCSHWSVWWSGNWRLLSQPVRWSTFDNCRHEQSDDRSSTAVTDLTDDDHHHYLSLNCEGPWGTTDDLATIFLHFSLFSTALWDLPNSRPVHSLMLSSHLFLSLPCLLPAFTVPWKMVLARSGDGDFKTLKHFKLQSGLMIKML